MSRAAARAALLHMLPAYLASAGVKPDKVFRQVGMSPDDVTSAKVVSRSQIHHALALSARYVGVAEIGLSLGATADPAQLGPIGLAMEVGATAETCLQAQINLMPTMQSHTAIVLQKRDDEIVWTHQLVGDDESSWLLNEGAGTFIVSMLRHLLGDGWAPNHISFPHHCKGRRTRYEDHFRAPVSFGDQGEMRIHMKRADLSTPLRMKSSVRDRLPGSASQELIEAFRPSVSDIDLAVRRMVDASLAHRPVTLSTAARILGLSSRTLQRRLDDCGTPFEQILDDRRHQLATAWLRDERISVTEVAMRLGYSAPSHFNRAFLRWEGRPPIDYRREGESAAPAR
ncbi:AraC family transcriptional regulator [uncultured Bosea sp.]|uniref:AraC family transcriptional regulator n=1 Tax=uncultured Bosea sp. TaxID=211457 RepID=UPI0025E0DC57|nr:AraC family transcriptional regulator [uncultured Bosea sp.]